MSYFPQKLTLTVNRLANAKSAFLRQAADSPIDWWPWCDEAFEKARREDKPVLVDVGASWCHWCHVMDETTYRDPDVVSVINENFVAIKVDRDERPDLDRELQMKVQAISGESGWPLTVFMTPEKEVFFGGTYFPPRDVPGRVGMKKVLTIVLRMWKEERHKVKGITEALERAISEWKSQSIGLADFSSLEALMNSVASSYDLEFGGLGNSMKFPHPTVDQALMAHHFLTGDDLGLKYSSFTLRQMSRGGIFDQVGGGFHRYTVDRDWGTPHFEKLLVDNAELLSDLVSAYQLTQDDELFYTLKMTANSFLEYFWNGDRFYNSIDADSDGIEGGFYTWDYDELVKLVGADWARVFARSAKRVEGRVVLRRAGWVEEISKLTNVPVERAKDELERKVKEMKEYRDRNRSLPYRDPNAYSYQQCVAGAALIEASPYFPQLASYALTIASKLLHGSVGRTLESGGEPLPEDLATCSYFLFKAYSFTSDPKFRDKAVETLKSLEGVELNASDNPNESARSLAAKASLFSHVLGLSDLNLEALKLTPVEPVFQAGLITVGAVVERRAWAHIVVVDEGDGRAEELVRTAWTTYHPFKVIELVKEGQEVPKDVKEMVNYGKGKSRAYVCAGKSCSLPVREPQQLRALIKSAK